MVLIEIIGVVDEVDDQLVVQQGFQIQYDVVEAAGLAGTDIANT